MKRVVFLPLVLIAACAPEPAPKLPPPTSSNPAAVPLSSAQHSSSPADTTTTTITPPAVMAAPMPFDDEARALLLQLAAVDTSHGGETKALRPIADRLQASGVHADIIEHSPGRGNLIARIKGNGSKKPLLLIAHVDVVPVEGQPWSVPPFPPTEKDGFIWGRGIADDKSMAAVFTAVTLEIARSKTVLARDIILALTAGEETGGFEGAKFLVEKKKELIDAEFALNEGGATITTQDFSDVQLVGIGVAEKSYQSYRIIARGGGGHSSMPKPGEDPSLSLARALVKVGELKFGTRVLPQVKNWFAAAASWEKAPLDAALKSAAASSPKLLPADEKIIAGDRTYGALLRTTCVTTMLQGSPQDNVLPTSAEAVVNCRILPDETREQTQAAIVKAINDPKIEVKWESDHGVGPMSPADGEIVSIIEKVAAQSFPKAKVATSMSTGATDSRHLRAGGIVSYGLGCAPTSIEEARSGRSAHGPDERRPTKWLGPGARYLRDVVMAVAK
jgi:acetylornithine deacetylase/succinyl-diaminopimelate desuccinylase-like protein